MIATKPTLRRSVVMNLAACGAWQSDESEAARFGSLVHECIRLWTLAMCANPQQDTADVMDRAVLMATLDPAGVGAERFPELRELCRRFAESHEAHPDTLLYCEQRLVWEGANVVLTGTPDRVDLLDPTRALISDWKSGWSASEATDTMQMRFYSALLFLADAQLQTIHTRVDYVRLSDAGVVDGEVARDDTLAWWHGEIVPLAESIAARSVEEQQPIGGSACRWCRRRWECPEAIAPARNLPRTTEEAHECFNELVRLEAGVEERRKVLREWYGERDAEVINGEEVGFLIAREPSLRVIDTTRAVAVLNERGLTGELLILDKRQLNKRAKDTLVRHAAAVWEDGDPEFKHRAAK